MAKKVSDSDIIFLYDNLLNLPSLHFKNSVITISSMPSNFRFAEDPNPPATIVTEEEPEAISLVV